MAARKRSKRRGERISAGDFEAKQSFPSEPVTVRTMVRSGRVRFAVAFSVCCSALYAVIHLLPPSVTKYANELTACTLGLVMNASGIPVLVAHDTILGGGQAFTIIPECTPLFMVGLFLCFVVCYPAGTRQKAVGILIGIPALYLGNLVRLAATLVISRYDRNFFEAAHVYLGQVFTLLLVVLACVAWLQWRAQKGSRQSIPITPVVFIARFALISGCLFLVWVLTHHWYISLLDRLTLFGFFLFDYHVGFARDTVFYYETFSIVGFTAIVLSLRSIPWRKRSKGLAAGLGFLFLTHLFHRIDNVMITLANFTAAFAVDSTLLVTGQYLLPVLLVIFMAHEGREKSHGPEGVR